MKKFLPLLTSITMFVGGLTSTYATSVAIVKGSFYTPNLRNQLVANGVSVDEPTSYSAASLAGYDAVIMYGNAFVDFSALETYVNGGGRLIQTPWAWLNHNPTAPLDIFTAGGTANYNISSPGVTVHSPSDPLLNGVTFPGPGGAIGRTGGNNFEAGVTQVASWADGTAMIGYRSLGSGDVVGINLHVITSDTAYQVIDEAWATQLFLNAVGGGGERVPEGGATLVFLSAAMAAVTMLRRK